MMKFRNDIQAARGIAIALVLVFHFSLFPMIDGGFMGVDVFFVISGYLITGHILSDLDRGQFSFREFYARRVKRLAPSLVATLLLALAAGCIALTPSELIDLCKQTIATLIYLSNVYYWKTVNYFGLSADDAYLLHTWSLSVEEQFYVFYPMLLVLIFRFARRHVWLVLALIAVVSFGLNVVLLPKKPEAVFYLFPTRAWELIIGALIHPISALSISRRFKAWIAGAGLALIGVAVVAYDPTVPFPGWFALAPVTGSFLILLAGTGDGSWVSETLGRRSLLTYLGRISYPLYLVHWPVIVFSRQLHGELETPGRFALCALSLALAAAIQVAVEDPIRRAKWAGSLRAVFQAYGTAVFVSLALCFVVIAGDGWTNRFDPEAIKIAEISRENNPEGQRCELSLGQTQVSSLCTIGKQGVSPTWFIYGDSHALAAYSVFDDWLKERNEAAYFAFRHACLPVDGLGLQRDGGTCLRITYNAMALIASVPVQNVLLVSTWRQVIEGRLVDERGIRLSKAEAVSVFDAAFHRMLQGLKDRKVNTVIWEPVPGARKSAPSALAKSYPEQHPKGLEYTRDEYEKTFGFIFKAIERERGLIAGLISPRNQVCSTGVCVAMEAGQPLYADTAHISQVSKDLWLRMMRSSRIEGGATMQD